MDTKEKVNRIMKYTDWLWKHWKYYFFKEWEMVDLEEIKQKHLERG